MTLSNSHRWLLGSAALLALPVLATVCWMICGGRPESEDHAHEGREAVPAFGHRTQEDAVFSAPGWTVIGEANSIAVEMRAYASAMTAQDLPRKTVRELVASRVTAAFEPRRTAIRNQARRTGTNPADIQAQLDALAREQGALIAELVGEEQPQTASVPDDSIAANAAAARNGSEQQILMPAVMAEALPATVTTQEQAGVWEKLRDDFVNAIDGPNQDPASPRYRHRWVQAQSEADLRFRLLFGDNAFVAHQLQAQHEAAMRQAEAIAK